MMPRTLCSASHRTKAMLNTRAKNRIKAAAAAITLDKPLRFSIAPAGSDPDTGNWTFRDDEHIIKINEDCPATKTRKTASATQYALAILEHEKAHAVYTERDFDKANAVCRNAKAPFLLFNLFEDARIEFLRRESGKAPLHWLKFDKVIMPSNPISAMFSLMQREIMRPSIVPTPLLSPNRVNEITLGSNYHLMYRGTPVSRWYRKVTKHSLHRTVANTVWNFYVEIVNAKSSFDLEALLKRWMELFPWTSNRRVRESGEGTVYGGTLPQAQSNQIADSPSGENETDNEGAHGQAGGASNGQKPDGQHNAKGTFLDSELSVGNTLAGIMARSFRLNGINRVASDAPSKRLNLRGMARGDYDKPYRRIQTVKRGIPHVSVVVDLSASMEGKPVSNARCIVVALNALARQGVIRCTAYATAQGGCQTSVDLPASPQKFHWRAYSGSEGMNTFFRQMSSRLSSSDLVIFVTDGNIGDKGEYLTVLHQQNVFVIGAYASDDDDQLQVAAEMCGRLFDKIAITKDLPNLAHRLGQLIATHI